MSDLKARYFPFVIPDSDLESRNVVALRRGRLDLPVFGTYCR
jgi:hypothetical protein